MNVIDYQVTKYLLDPIKVSYVTDSMNSWSTPEGDNQMIMINMSFDLIQTINFYQYVRAINYEYD